MAHSRYEQHSHDFETPTTGAEPIARIKTLSGGDPISARFMRQDFFTFQPTFKLLFVGNHAPNLEVVDQAMRRRFCVVPFDVKPKVADPRLVEKLRDEVAENLQWPIEGCLDWGLFLPKCVQAATGSYFVEQDLFEQWMNEKTMRSRERISCWGIGTRTAPPWEKNRKAQG